MTAERILSELTRRAPGYMPPGWAPRPDGGAAALLGGLAHLAGIVADSVEDAPDRLLLAFLDAMGVSLLPPSPARAPLVFRLAADAPFDVALPQDTPVAAERPPVLPTSLGGGSQTPVEARGPVVFATDRTISLTRGRLVAVQSVVPFEDGVADHTEALESGFTLFDDLEQVPHHLYLGDDLFAIAGPAEVGLTVAVSSPAGAPGLGLRWEYHTDTGWQAFDPVQDHTDGLRTDGEVLLSAGSETAFTPTSVAGVESCWIRARVDRPLASTEPRPRLDAARARVSLGGQDIPLDAALADGFTVDTSKDFLPFGRQPEIGSTFLVACDEAFRQEGARVSLRIAPSAGSAVRDDPAPSLIWEVSTGPGTWAETPVGGLEQFAAGDPRELAFLRPPEWAAVDLDGQERFWLRARIASGSYGSPGTPGAAPPSLQRMTASFTYSSLPKTPTICVSLNRFELRDHSDALRVGHQGFEPFTPLESAAPAVELGLSSPPPLGLVSAFVDVAPSGEAGGYTTPSPYIWEYRSAEGWSDLPVLDETAGFRTRGMVQLIGQPDAVSDLGPLAGLDPGPPTWWVRARLKAGSTATERRALAGLHLNATWAAQRTSVRHEALGAADGTTGQAFTFASPRVLPGEQVEVQEWRGTGREWEGLFADVNAERLRKDQDPRGEVTGVWVRWERVAQLRASGPLDRHYTLEADRGELRFGDGVGGRIPPRGSAVRASYRATGGTQGDMPAGAIAQLQGAAPYIESVRNPVPAGGGADPEEALGVERLARRGAGRRGVWARGPQEVRHRSRAVCPADVEWSAHAASTEVAAARCLPATGPEGLPTAGWTTVIVAPRGDAACPQPSPELLEHVRAHLGARMPAAVAAQLRVVAATYQPVTVTAEVAVRDPAAAAAAEHALRGALEAFLHPVTGGVARAGWGFGDDVALSQVAAVVEGTAGVAYAPELQLSSRGSVAGERIEVPPDRLPCSGRHLIGLRLEG